MKVTKDTEGKSGTLDLAALDTAAVGEQGAVLNLLHPVTGAELGIRIRLIGADSDSYRKLIRSHTTRRINSRKRSMTPEEAEQEALALLGKATLGWEGVLVDGQEMAFSHANATELYRRFPWIKEQADFFIADRGNFLQD